MLSFYYISLPSPKSVVMSDESNEYSITWFIENYSYCFLKIGEKLVSPEILLGDLESTIWTIQLYPRGKNHDLSGFVSLYINRRKDDDGPEELPLKFEISLVASDGSTLHSMESDLVFRKRAGWGYPQFLQREELLLRKKNDYLPQDTLSVCCRLWKAKENCKPVTQISARTRIGIEKFSFLHIIDNFSTLAPNQKKTIQVRSPSNKGLVLLVSLYFSEDLYSEEKIMVEVSVSSSKHILSYCKLTLLNASGNVIECGEADNRFYSTGMVIEKLALSFTRQAILNRKNEFLLNDKLSLRCKCIFSTGIECHKIESTLHEKPIVSFNHTSKKDQNKNIYNPKGKLFACTNATNDFKAIYCDKFLTDVVLKTATQSFPSHKIVLCARSPVFKLMMTNDMKEKNTGCIQIDDLENDIVQQLLVFLYSDQLENLKWESAMKLYYAADKYEVGKLKVVCSTFLMDNLSISTASELLLLADTHSDFDLKKAVEDFIFLHENQVFGSKEWRNLIKTNPMLVSNTMCMKYI